MHKYTPTLIIHLLLLAGSSEKYKEKTHAGIFHFSFIAVAYS
jgi:hypothetical protein